MRRKGFTLIELIATVIILGLIGLIVYPTVNNIIKDNKEKAYQHQVKEIERVASSWGVKHMNLLPTVDNNVYYLNIDELYNSGLINDKTIYNPKTNEEMTGCVIIRWESDINQHTYTYDEKCTYVDLPEIVLSVNDGILNENNWASKNFYVNVSGQYLDKYSYCVSNKECTPNSEVNSSSGTIYVTTEGTNYVCAKGINSFGESETVCNPYNLDKNGPTIGDIVFTGTAGENDWYTSDVTVSYTDSNSISGIKEVTLSPSAGIVKNETTGILYTLTVTDNAGHTASITKTLKIDKTDPTVGDAVFTGTKQSSGWYVSNVSISAVDGSDNMSGHASTTINVNSITSNTNGQTVTVTTKDNAGNTSTKNYVVKVDKDVPTFASTTVYYDNYGNILDYLNVNYKGSTGTVSCQKTLNQLTELTNKVNCTATKSNGVETTKEITFAANTLMSGSSGSSTSTFFRGTLNKNQVKGFHFVNHKNIPEGVTSWDVSSKSNGSVMAWYGAADSNGLYDIYIGQNGGVIASTGSYLFANFNKMTTLDIAKLDTSKVTNMSSMFKGNGMPSINVSNLNTSRVTDMTSMFEGTGSTSINVSNLDTSNVTQMSYMFQNSKVTTLTGLNTWDTSKVSQMSYMFYSVKAKELDVSNFNTSNVNHMGNMFFGTSATNIDVSGFDTSNVVNMIRMFQNSSVKTLDVSNWNTGKVKWMDEMFYYSKVTTLDVSNWDTSSVTSMGSMFALTQITSLNVSKWDTHNVTSMSSMFYSGKITTLDVSNWDTSKVTSMGYMFAGSNLTSIIGLNKLNTSKVTSMEGMFKDTKITTLDLSKFNTSNVTTMSDMFANTNVTELDLSNFDTSKVIYMSSMFSGSQAKTIIGLDNFDTSNVTHMYGMFEKSQATSLNLSSFNTSNVYNMRRMFAYSKATSLDLSGFDTSNVTMMDNMFYNSYARSIDLSNFNTSKVKDMNGLFAYSYARELNLSSFDTSNVTTMGGATDDSNNFGMFEFCSATSIIGLNKFNTSKVTNMSNMFIGIQATVLDLSSFDTSKVTNMENMFAYSTTTTGYARTQADANKFNASSSKPSSLTFRVK